jgi:hypothetical protein
MIDCECPTCQKPYSIKPDLAGRAIKCSKCGNSFPVPTQSESIFSDLASKPVSTQKPQPATQAITVRRVVEVEEPFVVGFKFGLGMAIASALIGLLIWGLVYLLNNPGKEAPKQPKSVLSSISSPNKSQNIC